MNTKPILFSGPMIRALLEGRKTQTRRPVTNRSKRFSDIVYLDHGKGWWPFYSDDGESPLCHDGNEHPLACPYGQPSDLLWVRETFACVGTSDPGYLVYRATYPECLPPGLENAPDDIRDAGYRWKPSIHMPRHASRLTLEITDVRVEKLKDISNDDAKAEGYTLISPFEFNHASAFLNGEWANQYDPETWVWAIAFKVHQVNVDEFIRRQA